MNAKSPWLAVTQPRIGVIGVFALLAIANLTMPLSMDMYTPAIPDMTFYSTR